MPNLHGKGGTEALLMWHLGVFKQTVQFRGVINAFTHQLQLYFDTKVGF